MGWAPKKTRLNASGRAGSESGWKNAAHPIDRTANPGIGECWFTLAGLYLESAPVSVHSHFIDEEVKTELVGLGSQARRSFRVWGERDLGFAENYCRLSLRLLSLRSPSPLFAALLLPRVCRCCGGIVRRRRRRRSGSRGSSNHGGDACVEGDTKGARRLGDGHRMSAWQSGPDPVLLPGQEHHRLASHQRRRQLWLCATSSHWPRAFRPGRRYLLRRPVCVVGLLGWNPKAVGSEHRRNDTTLHRPHQGCSQRCILGRQPADRFRLPRQDHQAMEYPRRVQVYHPGLRCA